MPQDKEGMSAEDVKRYLRGQTSKPTDRDPKKMKGGDKADEDEAIRLRRLAEFDQLPKSEKYQNFPVGFPVIANDDTGESLRRKRSVEGRKNALERLLNEHDRK